MYCVLKGGDSVANKYVLAFDLGTSSIKVAIVDQDATIVASGKRPIHPKYPKKGWAESDPEAWWAEGCIASKELIAQAGIDPADIVGVGFDAPSAGFIPVTKEKGALYPSLIWLDFRAEEILDECNEVLAEALGMPGLEMWTGKDPVPKMCWVKRFMPDIWEEMDTFLADVGYLVYKATGELTMPVQEAFTYGYDWNAGEWPPGLLAVYGFEPEKMPVVTQAVDIAGYVTEKAAEEMGVCPGLPVTTGFSDCSAAEIGGGCVKPGDAALYVGTSMLFTTTTDQCPENSNASYTYPGSNPAYNMLLSTNDMSGGCIDWVVERLFEPEKYGYSLDDCYKEVDKMLDETPAGADDLFFSTSFQGERQPILDNYFRAGFWNLTTEHSRSHMVRAVYEGIAYQIRWSVETMEETYGYKYDKILMTGGGGKSDRLAQIIADVLGIPIEVAEDPGFAVTKGTAFLAFIAAGTMTFDDIPDKVKVAKRFLPREENKAVYDRGMYFYKKYYETNKGFFKELNK